jgi:hypothetical protein
VITDASIMVTSNHISAVLALGFRSIPVYSGRVGPNAVLVISGQPWLAAVSIVCSSGPHPLSEVRQKRVFDFSGRLPLPSAQEYSLRGPCIQEERSWVPPRSWKQ